MIKEILNKLQVVFFGDSDELTKAVKEYDLCKADVNKLHKFYSDVIENNPDTEVKKSLEDIHFKDLYELNKSQKENEIQLFGSVTKRLKEIMEGEKTYKYLDKMSKSIGKKRHEMPQVDSDNVADFVLYFSDKVGVKKVKLKLSSLKPAQDELNNDKIDEIVKNYKTNKKVTYVISNDNYLLDGHHRWAADLELKESNEKVSCYKIDLPIKDLISRSNKLKLTKNVDIDDETFKKAIVLIAAAKEQGFLNEDLIDLVKANTQGLIRVSRTVIRNGKRHLQTFWVSADKDGDKIRKLRNTPINKDALDLNQPENETPDYTARNKEKYKELAEIQFKHDSVTQVGDRVNVKYLGRTTKEKFSFDNVEVVSVDSDSISIKIPERILTDKKYKDNQPIIFQQNAIVKIPKLNNKLYSDKNNFKLNISEDELKERIARLDILSTLRKTATDARAKGYDVYADVLVMNDNQIRQKYAPFFSKYGNSFDPIKIFDEAKELSKEHFKKETGEIKYSAVFNTHGFDIDVHNEAGRPLWNTQRRFQNGDSNLPAELNKGMYHAWFKINSSKYWGGGFAKKLFCSYYDEYKKMGLDHLAVSPGLASGPYVWPAFGFMAKVGHARDVLANFRVGSSKIVKEEFLEQQENVESVRTEGAKIFVKYTDSEHEVEVTNDRESNVVESQYSNLSMKQRNEMLMETGSQIEDLETELEDLLDGLMGVSDIDESEARKNPTAQKIQREIDIQKIRFDELSNPTQTTNAPSDGTYDARPKKYSIHNDGIVINSKTVTHTITQEEVDEANRVFSLWLQNNPNADLFPQTIFTQNKKLKDASKVAFLKTGGGSHSHHVVNLKDKSQRERFEKIIGYDKYLKNKNNN